METMQIQIHDRTIAGKLIQALMISIAASGRRVPLREILKARIYSEIEKFNQENLEYYNGLVIPSDAEETLNGYRIRKKQIIDPEKHYEAACRAYEENGFFVLIDDIQADSLDSLYLIRQNTDICFVRLVPLAGG